MKLKLLKPTFTPRAGLMPVIISLIVLSHPTPAADQKAGLKIEGGDIRALVELVSKRTGRNFIVDPSVRAEVTFMAGSDITDSELYDTFMSILQVHGLTAIETGNVTKIVPMNRSLQNVAPIVGGSADPRTNQTAYSAPKPTKPSKPKATPDSDAPPSMARPNLDFGAYGPPVLSNVPIDSQLQGEQPADVNVEPLPPGIMEPNADANVGSSYVPPSPTQNGLPRLAPDEIVTQVIRLQYVPAITANATLVPLAGQGDTRVQINQTSNSLIVTGRAQNVERIIQLARSIDKPNSNDEFEMVNLKFAVATQVAQTIQQLLGVGGIGPDGTPMAAASGKISADERTNSVLISGDRATRERLRSAIVRLDVPRKEIGGTQIIRLRYADAEELAKTLQGITQGVQQQKIGVAEGSAAALVNTAGGGANQVTIIPDRNTNSLVVTAPIYLYPNIRNVIAQLDVKQKAVGGTRVVKLRFADAEEMAQTLQGITKGVQQNAVGTVEGAAAVKAMAGQSQGADITIVPDRNTNSLIVTAPDFLYPNIQRVISQLDVQQKPKGGTIVVALRYAKAEDLVKVLQGASPTLQEQTKGAAEAAQGGGAAKASGDSAVSVLADKATNSLIITAPEFMQANLRRVIAQLDKRRGQVLIEAVIAEVSTDLAHQLGVSLAARPDTGSNGGAIGLSNIGGGLNQAFALSQGSGSVGAGLLFGLGQIIGGTQFGIIAKAIKGDAATNILATPSLVTLDNEEAKIVVGQEVPFITGSYANTGGGTTPTNPFNTIERRDVGLSLAVTPQINRGKTINLKIDQEISNLSSSSVSTSDVVTNKRKITTNVMVEDGQVLVLGGLIEDSFRDSKEKVPVLGDIPFIGAAFRGTNTTKTKQNLMVFIHPIILPDGEAADLYTREKYQTMQNLQASSNVLQRGRPDQRAAALRPLQSYPTTVDSLHYTPPANRRAAPANTVRQQPRPQPARVQPQPKRPVVKTTATYIKVQREVMGVNAEPTPTYAPQATSSSLGN